MSPTRIMKEFRFLKRSLFTMDAKEQCETHKKKIENLTWHKRCQKGLQNLREYSSSLFYLETTNKSKTCSGFTESGERYQALWALSVR